MADTKISALTELAAAPAVDDVIPIVDTSATETKKITRANFNDGYVEDSELTTHAADTSTHGAADVADVSDIAVDANLSAAAQDAVTYKRKVGVDSGATPDYIGAAANDGVLRVTVTNGLTYTDGGNYITLAFDADYADISGNDAATDVTAAELEDLTDGGSADALHTHPKLVAQPKAITVEDPTNAEDITIWRTDVAITVTQIAAVLVGALTPSVTYTIRFGTDRSATGTEVVTAGSTVTSVSTGDIVTSFNDATIPADNYIWIETTAKSGTVTELHVTINFTVD